MCTSGHAVMDQNLCPASLYIEMVMLAANIVYPHIHMSSAMFRVQNLSISAPLVLNPVGEVLLKLLPSPLDRKATSFSLFTQDMNHVVITHATGEFDLHPHDQPSATISLFSSMNRLIDTSRASAFEGSVSTSGLKGRSVYQAFRRVVSYSECYRGVDRVYATELEAVGFVSFTSPLTQKSACDPILLDNFLQVAGIHVNCLSDIQDRELFMCTRVGDFMMGKGYIDEASPSGSWHVYSNLDRSLKSSISCDIFVLNNITGDLAVAFLGVTFKSVPMASLTRVLKGLNNQANCSLGHTKITQPYETRNAREIVNKQSHTSLSSTDEQLDSTSGYFVSVQNMFRELLGVPAEELQPHSNLEDIGVDSLMRTEVLTEINKRFNVLISPSSLATIPDLQSLMQSIFPGAGSPLSSNPHPDTSSSYKNSSEPDQLPVLTPASTMESDSLISLAPLVFRETKRSTAHSLATKWAGFCNSVYPMQMDLVTAYVVEAFSSLGVSLENLHTGQLLPEVVVMPKHKKLMGQIYAILESSNLIQSSNKGFVRTCGPVPLIKSCELHDEILTLYPHHASEHRLLKTTGSQLADCLTGAADPLVLLFHSAEARQLMEDVYTNAPMFSAATLHLSQYLVGVLSRLDMSRKIKILEIGAGTGGTTKALLNQLASLPDLYLEYTFTDISSSLLNLARKKFKSYDFIKYQVLDIEQEPSPELLGQYDIVISSNCIHATRSLVNTTSNIKKLLRPDGILCLIELTRNLFWFDLVFGLLEGWWLSADGRKHALASENVWEDSLSCAGFEWIDWSVNELEESNILRLIIASPSPATPPSHGSPLEKPILVNGVSEATNTGIDGVLPTQETLVYREIDGVRLCADLFYPEREVSAGIRCPIGM